MRTATALILMLTFGSALPAQSPVFEAASIRVRQGTPQWKLAMSGNRMTLESYTLFGLLQQAYDLQNYQVRQAGLPALVQSNSILYDITAKAEGDTAPTREQFRQMLQSLLADRFRLKVHWDPVEMPVYALIVGKGGPKLKPGSSVDPAISGRGMNYTLNMPKATVAELAHILSREVVRPVLDQTGLDGTFDIKLTYKPECTKKPNAEPDLNDISVFTAVQDQLGLKLEPTKAPIEMLAVDHVEKPSEN